MFRFQILVFILLLIDICSTRTFNKNQLKSSDLSVEYWQSEPDKNQFLIRNTTKNPISNLYNKYTISIDDSIKYQQIDGFGASLTDSSAWLLKYKLTDSRRDEIFQELFGDQGIRLSLLRQPMGSTDFSLKFWSFSDTTDNQDDFALNSFTLEPENEYIRPMLDKALNVGNGRIKLFASPWSPPAWMKTSKNLIGGTLRRDCYDVYADYFVKYLKENSIKGSQIYGITVQNEPYYEPSNYPGMKMNEQEQIDFIKNHLGPKLRENGLSPKILVLDHNFDLVDNAVKVALETLNLTSGAGFHHYNDENSEHLLQRFKDQLPQKDIWMTECGFGYWMGNPKEQFHKAIIRQLRTTRYWSKGFIMWNIALDANSKPNVNGDTGSNRGLLQIGSDRVDDVKYETLFYAMGHFSKFVDPNAFRISTNTFENDLETVGFVNPDNTVVIVVLSRTGDERNVRFEWKGHSFEVKVPPMSATTLRLKQLII